MTRKVIISVPPPTLQEVARRYGVKIGELRIAEADGRALATPPKGRISTRSMSARAFPAASKPAARKVARTRVAKRSRAK